MAIKKPSLYLILVTCTLISITTSIPLSKRSLYNTAYSNSECVSCITSSDNYCASSHQSYLGYCCSSTDKYIYSFCGSGSSYKCTDDSDYSSYQGYILCPTDYSACNTQSYSFYSSDSYSFYSNYLDFSNVCVYEASMSSSYISEAEVSMASLDNANAFVYRENSSGTLSYETELFAGDDHTVSISSYSDKVWIVIVPYSYSAYVSFTVKTDYDSYSYSTSTGLSGGAIAGIVIGSIAFIICIIGLSVWSSYMRRKRQMEIINNATQAQARAIEIQSQQQAPQLIIQSQPQPQMMEPQPMPMYVDNSAYYGYPGQPVMYGPNIGPQMYGPNMGPQMYDPNAVELAYPVAQDAPAQSAPAQTQQNPEARAV